MPLTVRSVSHQSNWIWCAATSEAERGIGGVMCSSEMTSDRTEHNVRLKSWNPIFSVALRVEHAQCWCLSSLPLWYATAVHFQQAWHRLTHGHLSYGVIQWPGCSCSVDTSTLFHSLRFALSPPVASVLPVFYSCCSHSFSLCISFTLSPTFSLASSLVSLPCLSFSLHPSSSLSPTLVATLKTVVTMVTAMCCGNVRELNLHRITCLTLKFFLTSSLWFLAALC